MSIKEKIGEAWFDMLEEELNKDYMMYLARALAKERLTYTICPSSDNVFRAYELTPFTKVRVVILGQHPYETPGIADGLAYSTPNGLYMPTEITSIFDEIERSLDILDLERNTDLTRWAKQGALLLNTALTVRENEPNSHQFIGWKNFTEATIEALNLSIPPIVFMLWGKDANKYAKLIDKDHHLILAASDPCPTYNFDGCNHFLKAHKFMLSNGLQPIDWF